MPKIALHPSLGTKVIEFLSVFGELPDHGVVAGQAVASAIDRLQGYLQAPVNDVDIFRLAPTWRPLKRKSDTVTGTLSLTRAQMGTEGLDYAGLREVLRAMRTYHVSSVSRDGLLNYVNCGTFDPDPLRKLSVQKVIAAFDLNCVRVGVDLHTKELVWDAHYERFLKHRCIEVVAMHTPWHTLLRAIRKAHELPDVRMDLEAVATVACGFRASDFYESFANCMSTTSAFGEKFKALFDEHAHYLKPYVRLEQLDLPEKSPDDLALYTLKPRSSVDAPILDRINGIREGSLHFSGALVHGMLRRNAHNDKAAQKWHLVHEVAKDIPLWDSLNSHVPVIAVEGSVTPELVTGVEQFLTAEPGFKADFASLTLEAQFHRAQVLKKFKARVGYQDWIVYREYLTSADLASDSLLERALGQLETRFHENVIKEEGLFNYADRKETQDLWVARELCSLADINAAMARGLKAGSLEAWWELKTGKSRIIELEVTDLLSHKTTYSYLCQENRKSDVESTDISHDSLLTLSEQHALLGQHVRQLLGWPDKPLVKNPSGTGFMDMDDDIPF